MIISGKYEVTEKVGQGGMGIVYKVRHLDLDTVLALKILPRDLSQDAELVERFRREARVMAKLDHRNIVRVFDFARDGETYYLIMEFLQGRNLHQILRQGMETAKGALPLADVLRVGTQIAEALAYAHGRSPAVVHRDIKPSNIIIEDETHRAVVTDFGIAKLMGAAQSDLTRTGLFVGTPKYCSPEQLRHDDDLDARVDVYSFGMVLYELFTGRQYFAGLKDHEVIKRVLFDKGENVVTFPNAPPEFARLVERAIARDRDTRYATAQDVVEDLHACLRLLDSDTPREAESGGAPEVDEEDIEGQIRALEVKRRQRLAQQARSECGEARAAAEAQAAPQDAPTAFERAVAAQSQAETLLGGGEYDAALGAFQQARAAFGEAGVAAERGRHERRARDAREAMAAIAERARGAQAPALAADAWARAEELARVADAAWNAGDHERATLQYGEASEAFGAVLAAAERARELAAIRDALPTVEAARHEAERAEAPAFAAAEFASAVEHAERLAKAVGAGDLTAARALLPKAREGFAAALAAAGSARAVEGVRTARGRVVQAREAAHGAGAREHAATDVAAAEAREAAGAAAEAAAEWKAARRIFVEAARLYERARERAQKRIDDERAQRTLAKARAAVETARGSADEAQAPDAAPTLYGRACELLERAEGIAGSGNLSDAANEYRRAADQFEHAAQIAARRTQRQTIEAAFAELDAARARAQAAGAGEGSAFASGEKAAAEARRAFEADDLAASTAQIQKALAAYGAAATEAELARRLAEADAALGRIEPCRALALEADAERLAPEAFAAADRLYGDARTCRERDDWEAALERASEAEERYGASLRAAVDAAKAEARAAHAAAEKAGATADELAEGAKALGAAERRGGEGPDALVAASKGFTAAVAAYRRALERADQRRLAEADEALTRVAMRRAEALAAEANRAAADDYAAAERLASEAAERRKHADADAALRLAAEAEARYATSLTGAARAAAAAAADAKAAAERAGVQREAVAPAAELERTAAQQLEAGELVAAATAFRRAAADYRAATERTATAANEARQGAAKARQRAEQAEAARRCPDEFRGALATLEAAERAFKEQRIGEAVRGFGASAETFQRAVATAERQGAIERAKARRGEAEAARRQAEQAEGATLAASELKAAVGVFTAAERAQSAEDFAAAEKGFGEATAAFRAALAAAERARAARETGAAEKRARALLAERPQARYGMLTRRRIGRAERGLARGSAALAKGDLAAARTAFEECAALLTSIAPPSAPVATAAAAAAGDDATSAATVLAPTPSSRRLPWVAVAGGATLAVIAAVWAIGIGGGQRPKSAPVVDSPASGKVERVRVAVAPAAPPAAREAPSAATGEAPAAAKGAAETRPSQPEAPAPASAVVAEAEKERRVPANEAQVASRQTNERAAPPAGEQTPPAQVALVPPPAAEPPPAPLIATMLPRDPTLEVAVGARKRFGVTVKNAAESRLTYAWSLDGARVGQDASAWEFSPEDADEGKTHQVKVQVASAAKQAVSAEWSVAVPPAPVKIVTKRPAQDPTALIGSEQELAVEARAGARAGAPLAYRWSVDGRSIPGADGPRFAYRVERPRADVEVTVEAPGRQAAVGQWRVRGEAPPAAAARSEPTADTRVAARTTPAPAEPSGGARREIDAWVDAYRQAYEEKNVDRLIALGVVPAGQRGKMAAALEDLPGLRVQVTSRRIDLQGDDTATVTFTRVDSFGSGTRTEKAVAIKKTLRKRGGAWIAE